MMFFEFLRDLLLGTMLSYLSLTNALTIYIETHLPKRHVEMVQVDTPSIHEEGVIKTLEKTVNAVHNSYANVLRNHTEFQRASLIASTRNEVRNAGSTTIPLHDTIKQALVNIYCQYKTDTYIRTTTGTGFFINTKGVILTNAHVAQFLLLEDATSVDDVDCVIRSGDPATAQYKAELLYISPLWIFNNATLIDEELPRGTGERDYALLYISKTLDNTPLPVHFPSIAINVALLSHSAEHSTVITAGYPAEILFRSGVDAKLPAVIASTTINTLYTFGSSYADIFSIAESPVGQQGASGGPIIASSDEEVIGLIVTKGDEILEGPSSLRALTLSYVDRTITEETGFSLDQNMRGDVAHRGKIFKQAMTPFLVSMLENELKKTIAE